MKTSQSTIGRSRIHDHLLLTKIKFKYFPRVTKYSFSIWFATSRLWVICVNILPHLCLFLCPGVRIVRPLASIRWSHDVTPDIWGGCYRVSGVRRSCRGRPHQAGSRIVNQGLIGCFCNCGTFVLISFLTRLQNRSDWFCCTELH